MKTIYLDNNATSKVADEVVQEMIPFLSELYGNPSSMHSFGGRVETKLSESRECIADLLGCIPAEIIFTSGGTESDNTAIRGVLAAQPNKRKLITTRVEHPAVLTTCREMANHGYTVIELGVDDQGQLDLNELDQAVDDDTALVSIMWANNETGVIFPVEQAAELVKAKGAIFHTDSVQVIGKIPIDLSNTQIDLLSLSGHKLHAPKGIGVLYIRRGTKMSPFVLGGHQEGGRRAGTENVPGIIALGKACEFVGQNITEENSRVKFLRDKLENAILRSCPGAMLNGDKEHRLPNTTNISFEYIEGEAILLLLDQFGICASSGSACTSRSLEPSYVLRAMGIPFTAAHGSIRFSLSRYNTQDEIDYVIDKMPQIVNKLRQLSPFVTV